MATRRGGGGAFLEVPFSSLSFNRQLNGSSNISLSLEWDAGVKCCEVFDSIEPWRDEIACYRDGELAAVGPLVSVDLGDNLNLDVRDLSGWGDKRWVEKDVSLTGDPARIFDEVFDIAMAPDDSPNITCHVRDVGRIETREYKAAQFQRAADAWRELSSSTELDYVTIGRTIYAGDLDAIFGTTPFIIHAEGLASITARKSGEKFATDVALVGSAKLSGRDQIAEGRATRSGEYYGVLQETYTDLKVTDNQSADDAAEAIITAQMPFPLTYSVTFNEKAQPTFDQMVPGRQVTMAVNDPERCMEVTGAMLLSNIGVSVSKSQAGSTETVTGDLVPVGEET